MHKLQVVLHRQQNQAVERLLWVHEGGVLVGEGGLKMSRQIHIHPQGAHIILKIVEFAIDKFIPAALFRVYVVQLG